MKGNAGILLKGFRFGMLLQIAIGPVCIFILQTGINYGFIRAETGVLGVTLVDALYIVAAILGIGGLIHQYSSLKKWLKYFGAIVLCLFGVTNILGAFNISILPTLNLLSEHQAQNTFLQVLLLTLSNPLTILFWAGVFSTKVSEENLTRKETFLFGAGAVVSTAVFLTAIALAGSIVTFFINGVFIKILNTLVGAILIFFGVKAARQRVQ